MGDDNAAIMDDKSMGVGGGEMQNTMACGVAGQHTIQESGTLSSVGTTLLSGCNTLNLESRRTAGGSLYKHARREQQAASQRPPVSLYKATGRGRFIFGNHTYAADRVVAVTPESPTMST